MDRQLLILLFDNDELVDQYLEFASQELGRIKINSIVEKIKKSSTIQKFLINANNISTRPSAKDYLTCINSIRGFIFSNQETISIAAIFLVGLWNANIGAIWRLSDREYLNKMFFSILDNCNNGKLHINHQPNFFERFIDKINRESQEEIDRLMEMKTFNNVFFDDVFFKAAKNGKKTEFRVIDNLDLINIIPNEVEYSSYNKDKKSVVFYSQKLNQNFEINSPYLVEGNIDIINKDTNEKLKARINYFFLQRLADISNMNAEDEGYEESNKSFDIDSTVEISDLLKAYLAKKYHISLIENPWLWVINFEIISEDMSKTSVNITEEKIKSLVELSREVDWSQLTAL